MARSFALQPQLIARPAIESREAGLHCLPEGLFIHEADHQNAAGLVILDHRRKQSIEFPEIELHVLTPKSLDPKKKARQDQPGGLSKQS